MKDKVCEVLREFITERLNNMSNTDQIELCRAAGSEDEWDYQFCATDDGLAVMVGEKLYGITIEECGAWKNFGCESASPLN